jgi:hypothetical protein
MMKLSPVIFETVLSEYQAEAAKIHEGESRDHPAENCMGCTFIELIRKDKKLDKLYTDIMMNAMLAINPLHALLNTTEFFGQLSGVFLLGMLVGRRQMMEELQPGETLPK